MKFRSVGVPTPEKIFNERRILLKKLALLSLLPMGTIPLNLAAQTAKRGDITPEKLTTSYNNYLEFTDNKEMVKHISRELVVDNWQVKVTGLIDNPMTINLHDFAMYQQVNRIYSLRCVEGWSAVIPWSGFMLKDLLKISQPKLKAKYVRFIGHHDPKVMVGQRRNTLDWPYTEVLRLDEALHPLTILATGMYNKPLPPQNGAPIRLVVPWKYGYKSIKAITEIQLLEKRPKTTWEKYNDSEYGFYGNVNPSIPHPRWSQRREVRLGELKKRKTLMLNGYSELQNTLYQHDDLAKLF